MISISGKAPKNISKRHFHDYLQRTLHEALSILNWKNKDMNIQIIVVINIKIPLGSGQARHGRLVRRIVVHPHPNRPFPYDTIRHELFHILLKSRFRLNFPPTTFPILTGLNYVQQSTRDNVEEYIVRMLNALFLRVKNGGDWYEAQLLHEKHSGFRRIKTVARQLESWSLSKKPFSIEIFKRIAKILILSSL
jgi:hypothetical protein